MDSKALLCILFVAFLVAVLASDAELEHETNSGLNENGALHRKHHHLGELHRHRRQFGYGGSGSNAMATASSNTFSSGMGGGMFPGMGFSGSNAAAQASSNSNNFMAG